MRAHQIARQHPVVVDRRRRPQHDVQVVEDKLQPGATDVAVDFIATPSKLIEVERGRKRPQGVKWDLLDPMQIKLTPPIRELQRMRGLV